ncbi:AraC family transcriptional regulator [Streptomyces sp. TRM66268-LWL]|uniref:AraC family transcriptional regulator n=1 Tax=Streptomyces polyasparticus TaxID=2767826 RepID=A0ABR7SP94_9ACTN|nr:AraC family transcriptional regulator [Streptomyces polyasparticus]MBC9716515.1 AraC family transcriptional regulator [Streptomyces polyasparticus]
MDILTEALASMRTGKAASVRTTGHAPWAMSLPPVGGAGFHVVLSGACWLIPPAGAGAPVHLRTGDVVFLSHGSGHGLADHPDTAPLEPHGTEFHPGAPLGTVTVGTEDAGGERTDLLCGSYHLDQSRPHPLVSRLPQLIHLPAAGTDCPELAAAIGLLRSELDRPRMGSAGIVPALIDSLLLYILRAWHEQQPAESARGWAAALADRAVAPALTALHGDPARAWTVQDLAVRAGLSRAAFAKRFTELVGEPPMAYLTRWRMTTAARLLRESEAPLAAVAARTGYGSEYAFAKAFKREYGRAPGGYRRELRAAA